MRIVQVTPPAIEPVTLAEALAHLRLETTDDNAVVTGFLSAARKYCEQRSHLCYITQTWDLYLDSWDGRPWSGLTGGFGVTTGLAGSTLYNGGGRIEGVRLPHGPVQSVGSVNYTDQAGNAQTWSSANYIVSAGNPARVTPVQNAWFPPTAHQADAVRIRYTAGYGDTADTVPELAKVAVKIVLSVFYEHRTDVAVPTSVTDLLNLLGCGSNLFA